MCLKATGWNKGCTDLAGHRDMWSVIFNTVKKFIFTNYRKFLDYLRK